VTSEYCTVRDLYDYGIPRGSLTSPARECGGASATTNEIELEDHGFDEGDRVTFRANAPGVLPDPLVEGTQYYVLEPTDGNHFSVSLTDGGAAVNLTTDGNYFLAVFALDPVKWIRVASSLIEDSLPAHVVPLEEPYPEIVKITCAELAAAKGLRYLERGTDTFSDVLDKATRRIERWGRGIPIRGPNVPPHAGLSAVSTVPARDVRGYRNCTDSLP
jgi:hypothetical protein